jgi:hypothetical protein
MLQPGAGLFCNCWCRVVCLRHKFSQMVIGTDTLKILFAKREVLASVCCTFRSWNDQIVCFPLVDFKPYIFGYPLQLYEELFEKIHFKSSTIKINDSNMSSNKVFKHQTRTEFRLKMHGYSYFWYIVYPAIHLTFRCSGSFQNLMWLTLSTRIRSSLIVPKNNQK